MKLQYSFTVCIPGTGWTFLSLHRKLHEHYQVIHRRPVRMSPSYGRRNMNAATNSLLRMSFQNPYWRYQIFLYPLNLKQMYPTMEDESCYISDTKNNGKLINWERRSVPLIYFLQLGSELFNNWKRVLFALLLCYMLLDILASTSKENVPKFSWVGKPYPTSWLCQNTSEGLQGEYANCAVFKLSPVWQHQLKDSVRRSISQSSVVVLKDSNPTPISVILQLHHDSLGSWRKYRKILNWF